MASTLTNSVILRKSPLSRARLVMAVGCLLFQLVGCHKSDSPNAAGGSSTGSDSQSVSTEGYLPEGAVFPTDETIRNGTYTPLSRPLYLYVTKKSLEKPETAAFLRFFFSDDASPLISEVGYFRLAEEEFDEQRKTLESAIEQAGTAVSDRISGQVVVDGSSTVYPVTQAVAEEFSKRHRGVRIPVGVSGTGGGFKRFCVGETDINNASRPISEAEQERCRSNGIEYVELKCCIDGLTVVVHPQNDWVRGLTVAQLKELWKPDSTIQKWSDLHPDFPNETIKLFGPDTDSGTFDYFTEVICGMARASRSDYQQSSDDNFLVTGISGDRFALAYFGYAYYIENAQKLKALAIAED